MPLLAAKRLEAYSALLHLPKDKDILDYIWRKLSEGCGPEKSEMLEELLEMHRTSTGFDPLEISKGRMKRIKAAAYKKMLIEINVSLQALIHSPEYKELLRQHKNFDGVMTAFRWVHEKLEKNIFNEEVAAEVSRLKKDLVQLEEYELLLCLYRLCHGFFESPFAGQGVSDIIEEYNQVKVMAELYGEHTLTGLKTQMLVSEAEKGNRNNHALINLYDQLCKLLIRQSGTRAKYETLTRIIRVSAHLENRKHYMEPYLAYTQTHFEEIVHVLPASSRELNITLAVFLNREPMPVRMAYLNKAMEEADKDRSHADMALFKVIHAELCCDSQDYETALKMLDEADYIILKTNAPGLTEIKLRAAQTRFYIYALLVLEGRKTIDAAVFEELIRMAGSSGSKRHDLKVIQLEMQGLYQFITGRFGDARNCFIKCAKIRENKSYPVFYVIDTFFQELLRKTPDQQLLNLKMQHLDQIKETFYSSLWLRMLKGAVVKRELYGEVML